MWRKSCMLQGMTDALRIVVVAPDLAIADPDDEHAATQAERSRARAAHWPAGKQLQPHCHIAGRCVFERAAGQLQPDMIIVDAESEARDALEHVVMATRAAQASQTSPEGETSCPQGSNIKEKPLPWRRNARRAGVPTSPEGDPPWQGSTYQIKWRKKSPRQRNITFPPGANFCSAATNFSAIPEPCGS